MKNSSRWRTRRRQERLRRIWNGIDSGLYGLSLLQAYSEENVSIPLDEERITENLDDCLPVLDNLAETASDETTGTIEEIDVIEALNLSSTELENLHQTLEHAKQTVDAPDDFGETYDRLREIEQYTKREVESIQNRRF